MTRYRSDYARAYAALWAYGADTLQLTGTELVYQTVAEMAANAGRTLSADELMILADLGCGVGRTVRDLALKFPRAKVVGFDTSAPMIEVARALLGGQATLVADLEPRGFSTLTLPSLNLENTSFQLIAPGHDPQLRGYESSCSVVVSLNTIERAGDVSEHLRAAVALVKPGGAFVLASSMNWQTADDWREYPTFSALLNHAAIQGTLVTEQCVDDMPYFEVIDARGAGEYYKVSAAVLRKPESGTFI